MPNETRKNLFVVHLCVTSQCNYLTQGFYFCKRPPRIAECKAHVEPLFYSLIAFLYSDAFCPRLRVASMRCLTVSSGQQFLVRKMHEILG